MVGKITYLNRLYSKYNFKTVKYGKNIQGASPPSIFIGRKNYPKVYIGPLVPQQHGSTEIMDQPESWLEKQPEDVISYRMQLIRGKKLIKIDDVENRTATMLREMILSKNSVEMEAVFKKEPRGLNFHEETQPFGPSALIDKMQIDSGKFDHKMEKAHYDTDLLSRDAIINLYDKGVLVSSIQKAFSIGSFGLDKNRKLVPTRWSITAVDDTLSLDLLEKVKKNPVIDSYKLYEFKSFNNYFIVLLTPTNWQYEFLEAFIRVMENEEHLFSDWEPYHGRKKYASIGGCYYSTRLAITEKLDKMKKQSGAIVFRESYPGYTPLGVWLVRECVRNALTNKPLEFDNMQSALSYVSTKLWLSMGRYNEQSILLRQKNLLDYN